MLFHVEKFILIRPLFLLHRLIHSAMFAHAQKVAYPIRSVLGTAFLFLLFSAAASAQLTQQLDVPDPSGGSPVALWENRAIVGMQGGACIFEYDSSGWQLVAKLHPKGMGNMYGLSVDIEKNRAIIGDLSSQRAFIFRYRPKRREWVQEAEIVSPTADKDFTGFGISVAIQGGTAVVGDHWDEELGSMSGAAYVYRRRAGGTWTLDEKLLPSVPTFIAAEDGTTSISFDYYLYGWNTSVDQGRAAIAAYWQGAAYVYRKSFGRWREQQVLEELYPLLPSVDIDGKFIAANTSEDVFVFNYRRGNWEGTVISQPDGDAYGANPVAITRYSLAFQREFEDFDEPEPRKEVFLYERSDKSGDWKLRQTLEKPKIPAFGHSLDLYGSKLLIGTEGGFAEVYSIEDSSATTRTMTSEDSTERAPEAIVALLTPGQEVSVYPVPLQDQLHVALGTPTTHPVYVTLYDMFGRQLASTDQVSSVVAGALTLDLTATHVPSGVVFLEINSLETGRQIMKLLKN